MAKKSSKATSGPTRSVSSNAVEGLVGYDIETGGVFDPLGFGKNCPPEQMQWYRAAELKHGRVCMLAALGQITQHFTHWDDPTGIFDKSGSAWGAMQQVSAFVEWRLPLDEPTREPTTNLHIRLIHSLHMRDTFVHLRLSFRLKMGIPC